MRKTLLKISFVICLLIRNVVLWVFFFSLKIITINLWDNEYNYIMKLVEYS